MGGNSLNFTGSSRSTIINSQGNIGVGGDPGSNYFYAYDATGSPSIKAESGFATGNATMQLGVPGSTWSFQVQGAQSGRFLFSDGLQNPFIIEQGALSSTFHIDDQSNVGFGTDNPPSKVSIYDGSDANQLSLGLNVGNRYTIGRDAQTGYLTFQGTQSGTSGYDFKDDLGNVNVTITEDGNIETIGSLILETQNAGIKTNESAIVFEDNIDRIFRLTNASTAFDPDLNTSFFQGGLDNVIFSSNNGATMDNLAFLTDGLIISSGATFGSIDANQGLFDVRTGNDSTSSVFLINDSGKIGIGESVPTAQLDVKGYGSTHTSYDGTAYRIFRFRDGVNNRDMHLEQYDDGTGQEFHVWRAGGNNDGNLQFATRTSGTNHIRMTIRNDGDVGIGTTSPDFIFHVKDSDAAGMKLESTGTNDDSFVRFVTKTLGTAGGFWQHTVDESESQAFRMSYHNGTSVEHKFQMLTGGDISIGGDQTSGTTTGSNLIVKDDGTLQAPNYGSGTNTGTETHNLTVDTDGNIIESPLATARDSVVYLWDEKSNNTAGGTFNDGAWRIRTLNTYDGDSSIVSVSSNQFTLDAGTYDIDASAPAYKVGEHVTRLQNITDTETTLTGLPAMSGNGDATQTRSDLIGRFTIAGTKTFEFQHACELDVVTNGLGRPAGLGIVEKYAFIKLTKVANP